MDKLIVDRAYVCCDEYPNHYIAEIDREYYLLPALNRATNDLSNFRKIPKEVFESKDVREFPNYRYVLKDLEKRGGYDVKIGRAITEKEFSELKEKLGLSDDDISKPYRTKRGAVLGKENEKEFLCVCIRVKDLLTLRIESRLREKGIEAGAVNVDLIEIRIPE